MKFQLRIFLKNHKNIILFLFVFRDMQTHLDHLLKEIAPLQKKLYNHPIYRSVVSIEDLRLFMQEHVFAVWDFMSLLKSLQKEITCIDVPWKPVGSPKIRRFINEIVLGEESDLDEDGHCLSHYEMYLNAMKQCGADTTEIKKFFDLVCAGVSVRTALKQVRINRETHAFVEFSLEVIESKKPHVIASVFALGREDLIPEMFDRILKELQNQKAQSTSKLRYYLDRHIEVDGDHHGPLAMQMIQELCSDDKEKWKEATIFAKKALEHRIHLWNGVLLKLVQPV